jgi:hypothetical protein
MGLKTQVVYDCQVAVMKMPINQRNLGWLFII